MYIEPLKRPERAGGQGKEASKCDTKSEEFLSELAQTQFDHILPKGSNLFKDQPSSDLRSMHCLNPPRPTRETLRAAGFASLRIVSSSSHSSITHTTSDRPLHAKHAVLCHQQITKGSSCGNAHSEDEEKYPAIRCKCEADQIKAIQRAIEYQYCGKYTPLDKVIATKTKVFEMLDQCKLAMVDQDLVKVLVEADIPGHTAARIVAVRKDSDANQIRFARILKVLLIHLTGNTDAITGKQLLSALPYVSEAAA